MGKYKVSAGHLYKSGRDYYIIPAEKGRNGAQFERYHGNADLKPYCHKVLPDGSAIIRSGKKINQSRRGRDSDIWHINPPVQDNSCAIELTEREVEAYRKDSTRGNTKEVNEASNLVLRADKGGKVPCFFVVETTDAGRHISFGHTAMFRIVYLKSIKEIIRQRDDGSPDFTEGLFGRVDERTKSAIAGRLRIEDALCTSSHAPGQAEVPQILLSPKPTTFQHYLVQPESDKKKLCHYGSPAAEPRGTKLYWHRKGYAWKAQDKVPDNISTKIRVMPKGSTYAGRIFFDNLDPVELGALMFVLNLPQGCAHKIGMGKPIGLGSVKIQASLHIHDLHKRYHDLAAGWTTAPEKVDETEYVQRFVEHVSKAELGTPVGGPDAWWASPRIKELRRMLDWDKAPDASKTRYLKIEPQNEYKNRLVLPVPTDVR